jgi:NAD(P)-dependent dehydrogenase (short-subunit alcohol dehydrogenase family)
LRKIVALFGPLRRTTTRHRYKERDVSARNQYDFTGRHAVVTGGGAGIGLAIAQRLIEGGATVSLWDRDPETLEQARTAFGSFTPHLVTVDVANAEAVEAAREATLRAATAIDILITSAGITGPNTTLWDYPIAEWDQVMNVNLRGPFLCCRALVPHMRTKG